MTGASPVTENTTPVPQDERRRKNWHPRFRSFRAKLMMLIAFAVSVPALLTCVILGVQLDRQARALFSNTLNASLETFSLILQANEKNLHDGLQRAATDNTLQLTLDLEIQAQLTKYIETQRQVLHIAFFGVYDRAFKNIAFSGEAGTANGQWNLVADGKYGEKCTVTLQVAQQLVKCNDVMYLVSVVPVNRPQDTNRGDAAARTQTNGLLGYLLGGTPLAGTALIESLQNRNVGYPLIWVDENLVYANLPAENLPPPENTYQAVREFSIGNTSYLGAVRVTSVGIQRMTYGVVAPLAPLRSALLQSVFTVAGVGLLLVAVTLLAGGFITNRMLQPIRQLREGAAKLGSGDLAHRISVNSGDELEVLAGQFNDMSEKLQESYSDLENKVELRTRELSDSLLQQTATANVLKVISRSTFDLRTVLDTLVASAARLCAADKGVIFQSDGEAYRLAVDFGMSRETEAYAREHPLRPGVGSVTGRVALEGKRIHVADVLADPEYQQSGYQKELGYRTILGVPLLREGTTIGVFVLTRDSVNPFTEKQIDLVTIFTDQAVIAMENVRLFNEIQNKSQQLAEASKHKSQFLANMSHELRTPMNAILGYTELILDNIYGEPSEKMRGVLTRVQSNGKHLLGLINDVLDLSKIEAGQLTLTLADYSIKDVIHSVFSSVESLAKAKDLALNLDLPQNIPVAHGDERRLKQVLLNLVGNAIKFTDKGEVAIKAASENGSLVLKVRDTGPGITKEDQLKIFDEFQQADSSTTKEKGGTGLGLAISKRIVEMHGGRLWVESSLGHGSTFSVTVPIYVERQAEPAR